nr:2-oxo acid dehydrogenase subunit E2 [Treponemataceae bacterium]
NKEGEIERKHFLDFNFTLDERICDGQYYAHALHDLKRFLKNPELLEVPPEKIRMDID